jgi:hypothetical protein
MSRDGGIGRRAGLRIQCRKACRFESCSRHQNLSHSLTANWAEVLVESAQPAVAVLVQSCPSLPKLRKFGGLGFLLFIRPISGASYKPDTLSRWIFATPPTPLGSPDRAKLT